MNVLMFALFSLFLFVCMNVLIHYYFPPLFACFIGSGGELVAVGCGGCAVCLS